MKTFLSGPRRIIFFDEPQIWVCDPDNYLTPAELRLIKILFRFEGRPVSSDVLASQLSNDPADYGCSNPKFHIASLRKKLGHNRENPIIITCKGMGYYLVPGKLRIHKWEKSN